MKKKLQGQNHLSKDFLEVLLVSNFCRIPSSSLLTSIYLHCCCMIYADVGNRYATSEMPGPMVPGG